MTCFLRVRAPLALLVLAALLGSFAEAHVVRVEVTSRTDIQDGKHFGTAGAYEKITGRVYFAINPVCPHNRQIVDIDKAARNSQVEVEFSDDLYLLRLEELS